MSVKSTQTISSATTSNPVRVDYRRTDFQVSLAAVISGGGSLTYTVQHTLDDPNDFASFSDYNTNADWLNHDDLNAKTVTDDGAYAFPIQATRIDVTSFTSGSVKFTVLQG